MPSDAGYPIHCRRCHQRSHDVRFRWEQQPRRRFGWFPRHHQLPPQAGQPSPCPYDLVRFQRERLRERDRRCEVSDHGKYHIPWPHVLTPITANCARPTVSLVPAAPPSCSRLVMGVSLALNRATRAMARPSSPPSRRAVPSKLRSTLINSPLAAIADQFPLHQPDLRRQHTGHQ